MKIATKCEMYQNHNEILNSKLLFKIISMFVIFGQ